MKSLSISEDSKIADKSVNLSMQEFSVDSKADLKMQVIPKSILKKSYKLDDPYNQ